MEIKTIQCPSCGGNLKVDNPNLSLIYCQFCGCQISLETNRNKAYDTEQGRLDARGDRADEVLAKIEKIKDKLILNYNAAQEMEDIPGSSEDLKPNFWRQRATIRSTSLNLCS